MLMTPEQFRGELDAIGLSQSGLARYLLRMGSPRSMHVLLRWIHRAAEWGGDGTSEHLAFVVHTIRDNYKRRELLRQELQLLESGKMRTSTNHQDTTQQVIGMVKQQIMELDGLLIECHGPQPPLQRMPGVMIA